MGQQQLLLVILVTILVGIATVVGINVFGDSAENANQDAVRQDLAQIASSAQAWMIKPEVLGGGDNKFSGITFDEITFPGEVLSTDDEIASNLNGTYHISSTEESSFTVIGYPSSDADYTKDSTSDTSTNYFEAEVTKGGVTITEKPEDTDT